MNLAIFAGDMRSRLFLTGIILFLFQTSFSQGPKGSREQKTYFKVGERLDYNINYGWFKLGEAEARVDERKNLITGIDQLSIDLKAKTVGFLSFINNVDAHYLSLLQKNNYKPTYSENQVTEAKDQWDQTNFFDYDSMTADVSAYTNRKNRPYRHWIVDLKDNTFDILGTYMHLRNIEWGKLKVGDSIMISTLYEHTVYDFGVESGGFEEVKWNGDVYNAYMLYILFPISKTFPKEKLVKFWVIEKDGVHLPILIEANMRIGRITCELAEYTVRQGYH